MLDIRRNAGIGIGSRCTTTPSIIVHRVRPVYVRPCTTHVEDVLRPIPVLDEAIPPRWRRWQVPDNRSRQF